MTEQFAYSLDEEHYHGTFDTPEMALAEGKADAESRHEVGETVKIWVGKGVPVDVKTLLPDSDDIIDRAQELIYEHVGEIGDTYLSDWHCIRKEKAEAIDAELVPLLIELFKRHGVNLVPHCYGVADVSVHEYEVNGGKS